jgi:hypothetical protein
MLLLITITELIELTINVGEFNNDLTDGVVIQPPVKHRNKVGIIF